MIKLIIGVVIATVIVITAFLVIEPTIKNATQSATQTTDDSNTLVISVTVEGEVVKTGSYTFTSEDITMADLIEKAGGITTKADERAFFEETTIKEGMTYYIPSRYDASDVCSSSEVTKVNINEDSAEDLMKVSGFTSSIANSVVSYRASNGQFKSIEELTDVYGIGNATYRKVRNYVILHS